MQCQINFKVPKDHSIIMNHTFRLPDSFTQLSELHSLCMNDISLNRIPPDIGRYD